MATEPKARTIETATQFTGIQRQWVKAVVREAVQEAVDNLMSQMNSRLTARVDSVDALSAKISKRINDLEARYAEDDKYTLTTAKLRSFMDKLDK